MRRYWLLHGRIYRHQDITAFQKIYTKITQITKATCSLKATGVGYDELATVNGKLAQVVKIAGDEVTPDAPEIATTICQSGILKDAYREAAVQHGALFTFPSKKTRIDFIFVKHATVLSTRTIVSSLSDHYPMVIVVEI